MSDVTLRNISPLGFLDVPILGRQGPAPSFAECAECLDGTAPDDHEHELVDAQHGEPGSGSLVPGEEFPTTPEIAKRLLEQVGNFVRVAEYPAGEPADSWTKTQLAAYAADRGISTAGATNKGDLLAAIKKG